MAKLIATTCEVCKDEMTVEVADGTEIPEDVMVLCGPCQDDQYQHWQDDAEMWADIDRARREDEEMYGPNYR